MSYDDLNPYEVGLHKELERLKADLRDVALDYLAADGQAAEAYQAQLKAEAKLDDKEAECRSLRGQVNMAIDALQKVQDFVRELEPYADQGHTLVPALHHACTVLNKLMEDRNE